MSLIATIRKLLQSSTFTAPQSKQVGDAFSLLTDAAITSAPVLLSEASAEFAAGKVLTAGTNITLTPGAGTLTIAASGGSGGGNAVYMVVDFGANFTHYATASVVGESWVTPTSKIVVTPIATVAGEEVEIPLLSFQTTISDLIALSGFTLNVYTPIEAKGTYTFCCVGV